MAKNSIAGRRRGGRGGSTNPPGITFTDKFLRNFSDDVKTGRIPIDRPMLSDELATGLRAIFRNTGAISFHVSYYFDGSRPLLKIGNYPDMSIEEARKLTRTIRTISELGIDPQAGLHDRLIRELKEQGAKWRPNPKDVR